MLQIYLSLVNSSDDKEKIRQIYHLYQNKMYVVAYQILHNKHDAEDAVQDSFIAIIDNLEKIIEVDCHKTWNYIVTIVKSRALNLYYKKAKRSDREVQEHNYERKPCGQQESPEEVSWQKDVVTTLQELILELPYPKRQIMELYYYVDMPYAQIAKIVDLSEENVRQIAARTRRKLEEQLRERGITDGDI